MRGKGEGSVYQQKDGLWAVAIELPSHDGSRRRKVIRRKDKRAVLKELERVKAQLAKQGNIITDSINVETWFTYWTSEVMARNVRPTTATTYQGHVDKHIVPFLGPKKRLDKITPQDIRKLESYYIENGYSSTYARSAYRIVKTSFDVAVREGRIPMNPASLVDSPKRAHAPQEALTAEEAIKVLEHVAPDPLGPFWATAILTGARRNEVLGLEIDRVGDTLDFSWQLARLKMDARGRPIAPADFQYRELGDGYFLTRPKSSAGWRVVPLVDPLRAILERHIATMEPNPYGLLFTRNGRPIEPTAHSKRWHKVLAEAGIDRHVVLHGLRHTAVDLLYLAGVPEDLIQEIVGHSSRGMTRSYKSRGNIERLTEAMQRMSAQVTPQQIEEKVSP